MKIQLSTMTVADYCAAMNEGKIIVNREYQRSDKVWPPAARSFLIETILLDFPIPKLSLYQKTDIKSKETVKEIVDGQQRSKTILDFFNGKLQLSAKSEVEDVGGKTYEQLDEDQRHQFLNYGLSIDLFVSATQEEIREIFRRINSYTVPLNPEERRHAEHQGEFKWFIYRLSKKLDQRFFSLGVFGEKQLVRMADAKLFSEIIHALLYGVQTTKETQLNRLYEEFDDGFPQDKEIESRVLSVVEFLLSVPEIHKTSLMKPHMFYALALAVTHRLKPVDALQEIYDAKPKWKPNRDVIAANLSTLVTALDAEKPPAKYRSFVDASSEKTNVARQRATRVSWFCRALSSQLL